MARSENIVSYTADELRAMRARGESLTDHAALDAMTEEELEASIDHDEEGEVDWSTVQAGIPGSKERLTVRFDIEVVDWFKAQGPGYQTRMNEVLKSYVRAQTREPVGRGSAR
ncbi:MAG TPA: BrnA antitoxin family protein [Thermomicrobiales bacterium]|nr:BrnA antitoxin family protein [Thermomicrobiales bacterium]